jgi:hypothetical protein
MPLTLEGEESKGKVPKEIIETAPEIVEIAVPTPEPAA